MSEPERRAYESDGLTAYRQPPLVVVLPSTVAQVSAVLRYCQDAGDQGRAARRRHVAVGRRAAAGRRRAARHGQVQPHPRHRLRQPLRRRAARGHQSRHQPCGRRRRLLLRARPVEPDRLHDRRQCRREFGRRALPQIRPHHQQPARPRNGADRRRGDAPRRQAFRCRGLRSDGRDDRLRGAAWASSPRSPCASSRSRRPRAPC